MQVDVALTETLRILPSVAVAVTDENGASAGPAVKMLSMRGQPHEMSATTRFGGETLAEFNEVSPLLRDRRLWHSAKLSGRDRFNKLDEFDERSLDLDARIGLRAIRASGRAARCSRSTASAATRTASRSRRTITTRS